MPFKEDKPLEPGWSTKHWERSYNCANSRIYSLYGKSVDIAREYRASGVTRALARTINPPSSAAPLPPGPEVFPDPASTAKFIAAYDAEVIANRVQEIWANMAQSYPLSVEQKKIIETLNKKEADGFRDNILEYMRECAYKCPSGDFDTCTKHRAATRELFKSTYLDVTPGSWASYRPTSYFTELSDMINNNLVDFPEIIARIAKEQRLHTKLSLCTILPFDHPECQQAKNEAADMFDDAAIKEKKIRNFLEDRDTELRAKLSPEELELEDKFRLCETKEDEYAFFEHTTCDPSDKDSIADTKMKSKWRELFKSKRAYDEIRVIMKKDIEQAGIVVQSLQTRIADIEMAQAGHIRDKEKKNTAKQDHRLICSGSSCNNVCVGKDGMEPIQCVRCKTDCLAMNRDTRSYFCSQQCVVVYGVEHRLLHHAGPECAAHDCNNNCVGTLANESPQCLQCKTEFDSGKRALKSYFCSQECVDRSGEEHNRLFHLEPESTN